MEHQREPRFSIAELEEATGIPRRTIRFYIDQGIVPPAIGRGRSASYDRSHVQALALAGELRQSNRSIEEIREALAAAPAATPTNDHGDTWHRHSLHPTLEINLRDDAPEHIRELCRRLLNTATLWLGDDEG